MKAADRAAARRIPDQLAFIGYMLEPQRPDDDDSWMASLGEAIESHIERLAQAEHLGWCAERFADGWTYAEVRDNVAKHHPSLVPWAKLPPVLQDQDRAAIRAVPGLLEIAQLKVVPLQDPIEDLAAAIHSSFLDAAAKSRLEAAAKNDPRLAWMIDPSIDKPYVDLADEMKAANRTAARRVLDHLAHIGYGVEPRQPDDDESWKGPLSEAIATDVERLAQAEHLGWCAERFADGWTYAPKRDNAAKHHPLLVPWATLSRADQDKDRAIVRAIPGLLEIAGFKAVPVRNPEGVGER